MKNFWKKLKEKFSYAWGYIKAFLSLWQNWVFVISVILSVVFLSMWNVYSWCKIAGIGSLCISTLFVALIFTVFYNNFIKLINAQKREILESLAKQFDKEEYLQLKTPFNENDEQHIQQQIKNYRNIMIFFWIIFVVCVYVFITLLLS